MSGLNLDDNHIMLQSRATTTEGFPELAQYNSGGALTGRSDKEPAVRPQVFAERKFAITGASRGLGAALALAMARSGARLVLLARTVAALQETASTILEETGQQVSLVGCDLANRESVESAGRQLAVQHSDMDGLIHNGAMWLPGSLDQLSDLDIHDCISSAAIGALVLTRHVLPNLKARAQADIHTVVSTSGLLNRPSTLASVVFRAAKSAQAGFVYGLVDELAETRVRVTSVFPGVIEDVSPMDPAWERTGSNAQLSNREVVDTIMFILSQPPRISIRSLVIE